MLVAWTVQRRRGRRLSPFASWAAAVITVSATMTCALVLATTIGPWRGFAGQLQRAVDEAQHRPPRPPPAIFRNLPPPQPLPPAASKVVAVAGLIMIVELYGLLFGSLAWASARLISYGVMGRPTPDPATLPPST